MARRGQRELTWQPYSGAQGGRWCKVIDGKRRYFGTARRRGDNDAYRKALAAYRVEIEIRDRREATAQLRLETAREMARNGHRVYTIPEGSWMPPKPRPLTHAELEAEAQRLLDSSLPDMFLDFEQEGASGAKAPGLEQLISQFLETQKERVQRTTSDPSTPCRDRLSTSGYRTYENSTRAIKKAFAVAGVVSLEPSEIERGLLVMRADLDAKVAASEISASYADNLTRAVRPLFKMAWKRRIIDEMPRVLDEITVKPAVTSTASPLDHATILKIWEASDGLMKTAVALALNCGLYSVDIAQLSNDNLVGEHLATRRSKTNVPGRWKLWPVTLRLIEATRRDVEGQPLLLLTPRGKPLHFVTGKTTSDYLGRRLLKLTREIGVKAT